MGKQNRRGLLRRESKTSLKWSYGNMPLEKLPEIHMHKKSLNAVTYIEEEMLFPGVKIKNRGPGMVFLPYSYWLARSQRSR